MFSRHVSKSDHRKPRRASGRKERRSFSRNADRMDKTNIPQSLPKRGGGRL